MDHRCIFLRLAVALCIVYGCTTFGMIEGRGVVSPNMSSYMHRPLEGHEASRPAPREDDDFMSWVRRMGEIHRQKQLLLQRQSTTSEEYSGREGVRNSAMTWLDWKPTMVTPKTLIIVDQNGNGDFLTIAEAINSIPRNMYRPYRVTVQINAGVYRYYADPSTYIKLMYIYMAIYT